MKKINLVIVAFLAFVLIIVPVKADSRKKVQTNYQYKLVCGYYNGSDQLTWGAQENIGDFKSMDGSESNSNRACGTTTATKNYPIGDAAFGNLPREVTMTFDNCNGSTGKQKALVGQSCAHEGKVRTCTVKWTGYCYKETKKTSKSKKTTKKTNQRFTLSRTSLKVGEETKIKKQGSCYKFSVDDDSILKYDEQTASFKALSEGKTYINCYDEDGTYLYHKIVRVKTAPEKIEYRYVNKDSSFYKIDDGVREYVRTLKRGRKVQYLNVSQNGYCKIKSNFTTGYIKCENLNVEPVKNA